MKKSILLFVLVAIFATTFAAGPVVSVNDAKQTAANFLTEKCHINAASINLTLQYTERDDNGDALYYRFQLNNRGFVIVSASELCHPVLAFSYESDFVNCEETSAFTDAYKADIKTAKLLNKPMAASVKNEWNHYNTANFVPAATKAGEKFCMPLITTKWAQKAYYNQYCPFDGVNANNDKDSRTTVGNAAVAMASLVNYYRYPTQGYGGIYYTSYLDWGSYQEVYPPIYVNMNGVTYNYDAMTSSLNKYNGEVAKLLYHTGTSAKTLYSAERTISTRTETDHLMAFNALKTNWGFKNDANLFFRPSDVTQDSVWLMQYVIPELDARRPIFYSGYKDITMLESMCFLVDGYQFVDNAQGTGKDIFLHVNLTPTNLVNEMYCAFYMYSSSNFRYKYNESITRDMCPSTNNIEKAATGNYTNDAKSGTICDGAGNMQYQNNTTKTWLIQTPNATSYTFNFKRLNTEANNDVVRIYAGSEATEANLKGTYSGQHLTVGCADETPGSSPIVYDVPALPAALTVNSDVVLVTFTTNDSIQDYGFVLEYEAAYNQSEISTCAASQTINFIHYVLVDNEQEIPQSDPETYDIHSNNEKYGSHVTCSWSVRPTGAEGIYFSFPKFDLKAGDFIEVSTIASTPELVQVFNVFNMPKAEGYTVNANKMKVRFVTDNWDEGTGFELEYWAMTNINENSGLSDISIYPNPATNFINIDLTSENAQNINACVYDMSGKMLYSTTYNHAGGSQIFKLPVSNLASGIYFLHLNTPTGKTIQKFIVK